MYKIKSKYITALEQYIIITLNHGCDKWGALLMDGLRVEIGWIRRERCTHGKGLKTGISRHARRLRTRVSSLLLTGLPRSCTWNVLNDEWFRSYVYCINVYIYICVCVYPQQICLCVCNIYIYIYIKPSQLANVYVCI